MNDKEDCWKLVPLVRSYDMRAAAIIAFNTATAKGADRDDALLAAWEAEFHAAPAADHSVAPRQKTKTDLTPEPPGKQLDARTGDTEPSLLRQAGQEKSARTSIASQSVVLAVNSSPIAAESAGNTKTDCRGQLEALIDIYDDAHNNDPESRCYVDGAFAEQMAEARAFLKAAPQPQGGALTEKPITEAAERISRLLLGDARKVDCDIIESHIRELLTQSAPTAPQQAGDGLTERNGASKR